MQPINFKAYQERISAPVKSRIHTKEQDLADQIFAHFNKDIAFGRIMALIRRKGFQFVYEAFNSVRQSDAKNPAALFLWKCK